jgi:thiol-disulfide isomerase/thioredoxin
VNLSNRWTRSAGALAAAVALVATATTQAADAAPDRTATTTSYTTANYLQNALGLPSTDTHPAIEPVTYDRFQWLLQQTGDFAVLIGDPAEDATFAARAQDVEASAQAAGVKKVYWFDPNLSGGAQVGSITEPDLDIRDAAGIAKLGAASQAKYDNAWSALVGKYLGNGIGVVQAGLNTENATVTVTKQTTDVNDFGGTEVGNSSSGPLYDYATATPTNVTNSFFFIYNKDHTSAGHPSKIVAWTDLTAHPTTARDSVDTAIDDIGAANLDEADQFAWWKDEVNAKQVTQASGAHQGAGTPVLADADNADGWRIEQITYPELVDLLKHVTTANAVILFGGTWCPNTRPVLPFINQYAQKNDVHVYNFDTVLDGGLVGGSTTSASDPLQSRNTAAASSTVGAPTNANPSFLYGDLVSQYLNNVKTEYDYTTGGPAVTYLPGADSSATLTSAKKLQVPFVIGYQGSTSPAPNGGVARQWIVSNPSNTYTEYMSQWWYTKPQANQLGISTTQLPPGAPIWAKINAALADFTWQTDPATLYPNTAIETDDDQFLVDADTATVSYSTSNSRWTITSGGPIVISPAAVATALTALGSSAPANLAAAKTALLAAQAASTPDTALIANLNTLVGGWGIAQSRKTKVITTLGTPTSPGSVSGGLNAVHALDVFFGGLPGGVLSHRTVTADTVTAGTAPKVTIAITNDYGRVPTGNVALVVKQGGTTVASASEAVAQGAASFTLPALAAGTYDYTLSYAGDDQIAGFTETGSLTVSPAAQGGGGGGGSNPAPGATPTPTPAATAKPVVKPTTPPKASLSKVSKFKGAVVTAPTSKKVGKLKVTITTPKGATAATGKVTIKLKKGKVTKTITGRLSHGVVTVTLPKLARGTWKVALSWPGDSHYAKASATGVSIKVIK